MNTRFDPSRGLIVVPARVFGPAGDTVVRLALDTGATSTVLRNSILVLLGYDPAASPDRVQVTTGSGIEYCARIKVERLEVMGQSATGFSLLAMTLPPSATVDGLLGLDFLRGKRLLIDFPGGELSLT
jgi:predicted aspartyl protease